MKRLTLTLTLLVCALVIAAALVDLRCGATSAGTNTVIVACSAGRL